MKWIEQNEAGGSRKRAAQEVLHATQGGNPSVSLIAESAHVVKDGTAGTAGTNGKIWVRHVAGKPGIDGSQRCSECGGFISDVDPVAHPEGAYVFALGHSHCGYSPMPIIGKVVLHTPVSRFIVPCFNGAKAWGAGTHLPRVYRLAFYKKAA